MEQIKVMRLKGTRNTNEQLCEKGVVTANNGVFYDVLNLLPEQVDLEFIAHSLARICRYIGHVGTYKESKAFYSVAQHSVKMAEAVLLVTGNPKLAFQALHHDDGEAYTGDLISPLKALVKDKIKPIEMEIEKVICKKFGINFPLDPIIKMVDLNICEYEMSTMVSKTFGEYNDYWDAEFATNQFIGMHKKLEYLMTFGKEKSFVTGKTQEKDLNIDTDTDKVLAKVGESSKEDIVIIGESIKEDNKLFPEDLKTFMMVYDTVSYTHLTLPTKSLV